MRGRGEPRAVVFDVDGTLVDSTYLHTVAWWEALRQHDRLVPAAELHRAIGLPAQELLTRLLGEADYAELGAAVSAAHGTLYGQWHDRLRAFDRVPELLRTLAGRGWRVVLATSAKGGDLAALRRAIGADDAIDALTSAEDVEHGKPAPDPVRAALDLVGVAPESARFVGDSVWDVYAATAAGVACLGVCTGGTSRAELTEAGAVAVYDSPAALLSALDAGPLRD
ncbi:HAD family hydrolase [Streptomyces physcomitrii]|uniref:HAD family hydrolase n=1 Tax=Streptomyces physcomitrii TaxID=2724184 RepID=UPI003401A49F